MAQMSETYSAGLRIVRAGPEHLAGLTDLIFDHGANGLNYLPEDAIREHLEHVVQGRDHGVLALQDGQLLGAVTFGLSTDFDAYLPAHSRGTPQGYVSEAVVRRERTGQGLGTRLLREALALLSTMGVEAVFVDRHEENAASAGMMRKAGFTEVETYADPRRRPHGSGRTTVCRFRFADGTGLPGR
jgi:ribosomal protein S18 acetylase RimI-like enzyme